MGQKFIIGSEGAPAPFDASLPEQQLEKNAYTPELLLALHALQNGGVAPTISDLLASWNPIAVLLGGEPIINARAEALYALMVQWLHRNPMTLISAGDNQELFFSGLNIPLWTGPTLSELKVKATRVAPPATLDTLRHSIIQKYSPARPSSVPVYLRILEQVYTDGAAGVWSSAGNYNNFGNIVGMLVFSTNIGTTANLTARASAFRITASNIDNLVMDWYSAAADDLFVGLRASPADISILDNYRYWDLSDTPIPENSNPKIEFFRNATGEIRYYFVEQVRV